jgi:hypothetical protein
MMFMATDIASALDLESCDAAIEVMFEGQTASASYFACRALMHQQRVELLTALDEVVDPTDLGLLISTRYIEQKSRWLQWNLVLNYRMMMSGSFDTDLAYRASVLSNLLGRIEPFIDEASLQRINELLNEPILHAVQ